jgi:hypothetical protein
MAQPKRVPPTRRKETVGTWWGEGTPSYLDSDSQGSTAQRATKAQARRPHRQEPNWWAIGTVRAEPAVMPSAIAVVYIDVRNPTRCGKWRFTRDGICTLAVAVPASARTERSKNVVAEPTKGRPESPPTMAPSETRVSR